jgi:hypothetical protein
MSITLPVSTTSSEASTAVSVADLPTPVHGVTGAAFVDELI